MIGLTGTLSKAWMHRALGVVFNRDYYFNPATRYTTDCRCNEYAARTFPDLPVFYSESNLGRIDHWNTKMVQIGGIQPNMILAMLLGADFVPADDRDADVTPGCLGNRTPRDLHAPKALLNHDLIKLFDEQIATERRGPHRPIPPFYWDWSGRGAIHGALTTAQKLCGEKIFLDMLTEPYECKRLLIWIAEAYIVLYQHFGELTSAPVADVHVGECSCCMISPALVEEFVVPVTSRISEALGPVRFHSCGTSTHLLQALTRIDRLDSLDVGSDTSIGKAREIFGPKMPITIAPAPQAMSAADTGPILDWAKQVLNENGGGPLRFVFHLEPDYNIETIYALKALVQQQPAFENTSGLKYE
jgi:hypothetical protein